MSEAEVLVEVRAGVGRIRLNRPRQINALTVAMMRAIGDALELFAADAEVSSVELTGAGERGLCAGADVRALRELALSGDDVTPFFATEYGVNLQIASFPKPYRAVMTGITMGGGMGLSVHGSQRVVDATSRLAMPETQIGLFPDVFVTPLLARMPGEIGTHLALTGASVGAADALRLGLADVAAQWVSRTPVWTPAGSPTAMPVTIRPRSSDAWSSTPIRPPERLPRSCGDAARSRSA